MATVTYYIAQGVSANEERGAQILRFIAGEALAIGQAVYLDANNKLHPAKADSSLHASAVGIICSTNNFYGETAITSGQWASVCTLGPVQGWQSLIDGEPIWVDAVTAGNMVDTAPTGGAYQFVVGQARGADTINVMPGTTTPVSHA